ncbi:unnamed protein product [Cunninghamella echinulata]
MYVTFPEPKEGEISAWKSIVDDRVRIADLRGMTTKKKRKRGNLFLSSMIYDSLDTSDISFGTAKQVFGKKLLIPVFYKKGTLEFTERNRYVNVNGIETNQYEKKQLVVKSQTFNNIVTDIVEYINKEQKLTIRSPIGTDGSLHIENVSFNACISVVVPTYYIDGEKSTIQLNVGECVVIDVKESFEIDLDKLKLAE